MKYKILITEPEYFDDNAIAKLKKIGQIDKIRLTRSELKLCIHKYDAILIRVETELNYDLLKNAKRLKVIGSATTGIEHIDMGYAAKHNIKVFNLHGTHTIATAEHTMCLMLSLSRNLPWAFDSLKSGVWERHNFIGNNLYKKQLGIIGMGRIGGRVAMLANAFGMKVVYYDKNKKAVRWKYMPLKKLVATSDIISIHASLNDSSRNLIDDNIIKLMKNSAILINTARAAIVDYNSLIKSLKLKHIKSAAIDVYNNEPIGNNDAFIIEYAKSHNNLLITPHLGASTYETAFEAAMHISNTVAKYLLNNT